MSGDFLVGIIAIPSDFSPGNDFSLSANLRVGVVGSGDLVWLHETNF
jgi:hypothetical protein